ncbi:DUF6879 family protein [Streptodolium elevatio]
MPELITGPGITEFFRHGFEHTAWRLESRRAYGVASETEALQAFMRGEDVSDPGRPWLGMVREQVKQGKRIERVRVVDEPPTDYQRFLLADVEDSIAAGEDIRFLWRSDAETAGLPSRDFWVFDSHCSAASISTATGRSKWSCSTASPRSSRRAKFVMRHGTSQPRTRCFSPR